MTKYERLEKALNFATEKAKKALDSKNSYLVTFWLNAVRCYRSRIETLTIEQAMEVV